MHDGIWGTWQWIKEWIKFFVSNMLKYLCNIHQWKYIYKWKNQYKLNEMKWKRNVRFFSMADCYLLANKIFYQPWLRLRIHFYAEWGMWIVSCITANGASFERNLSASVWIAFCSFKSEIIFTFNRVFLCFFQLLVLGVAQRCSVQCWLVLRWVG